MRIELRVFLLVSALMSTACSTWRGCGHSQLLVLSDLDDPVETSGACASWRWIALTPEPGGKGYSDGGYESRGAGPLGCPRIPGWHEEPLFEGAAESSPLSRFCLYEHRQPKLGKDTDIQDLVSQGKLVRAGCDCAVVATAAEGDLEDLTWRSFQEQFRQQAGRVSSSLASAPSPQVHLVFLDTHPTSPVLPVPPFTSPHGYSLAHLARDLLCDGSGNCAASIATQLALPIVDFDPQSYSSTLRNPVEGGYVGTLGDLARAVYEAVQSSAQRELVLNLSVGWDPRFGGLETDELCENPATSVMPLPAKAVLCAVQDAVCRGTVIVAAAGNRTGGPMPEAAPLLPAAWETRIGPDLGACQTILGSAALPGLFQPNASVPLVHAVGGVDQDDSPIANGRRDSPPLVAFGDHAATEGHQPGRPTSTYTGTSVATAVVSATAAATWRQNGDLVSQQVMATLYDSAESLGHRADFFRRGLPEAPLVHRVRFCQAFGLCGGETGGPGGDASSRVAASLSRSLAGFKPECGDGIECKIAFSELATRSPLTPPCEAWTLNRRPDPEPANPCPFNQFYSSKAHPWTTPQPEQTPCPNCAAFPDSSYSLSIEIREDWKQEWPLEDAVLAIGSESYALASDGFQMPPGDSLLVTGIPDELIKSEGIPVVLWFRIEIDGDPVSIEVPVFVVRD